MNIQHYDDKTIIDGSASRFIKEKWIKNDFSIDATAFDLRDTPKPETYVSFFIVIGSDNESKFSDSKNKIPKHLISQDGAVIILEISECLDEINDELNGDLISFQEEDMPHCGLYYLTNDLQKIVKIKNTLCFLAQENFLKVSKKNKSLTNKNIPA